MEDPENGMNEHKNIEVTEIEEKKQLDLPLLLNGSPPFKPIISIDASVFLLSKKNKNLDSNLFYPKRFLK